MEIKRDAKPKFCKACTVPYALQEAIDAEYHRLETEGIAEKVEFSEWATPMVHVPKADGTTRSCGDSSRFIKLDLKNAYQQPPLDPDSQQFVTINTHCGLYRYKRLPFGIASFLTCACALQS